MNKKQVEKFIDQIWANSGIEVEFCSDRTLTYAGWADIRYSPSRIILNMYYIKKEKYNDAAIKGIILHEMGHILGGHLTGTPKNELCAQLFALKVADKFKMVRVFKRLLLELYCWGARKWTKADIGAYQIYHEAYRLFLRDKKLVRRYARKDKRLGVGLLYDLKHPLPRKPKVT